MFEQHYDNPEEIVRCLFRESSDALFVFDSRDHRILDVNPVALRLTGFDDEALLKMRAWELFQGLDPKTWDRRIKADPARGSSSSPKEWNLDRESGGPISVEVRVCRVPARPEPIGLLVVRDLSDRSRARNVLDRFFRLAPDPFAIVRPDADRPRFLQVNGAWEVFLGYPPEDMLSIALFDLIHPDDLPAAREAMQRIVAERELVGFEMRVRHRDGSDRWLSCNASMADGLVSIVCRDVTEEKRLETMRSAMERAELASRSKSELIGDIGHEIRTPVAAILEYAEKIVREEKATTSDHQSDRLGDLRVIRRNARYLVRLLGDLLDLSRLESGTLRAELSACSIGKVLAEVVQLMQAKARSKGLTLSLSYRSPIPSTIHTDETRLRQVLINLISNALKFTNAGTVRVEAALDETGPDGPVLTVDIIDTGIGMSPEVTAQLFTPFYRASGGRTDGAGLGLAISQRIAGLLGGRISVRSEPGHGSRFTLTLPTGPLTETESHCDPPPPGEHTDEWSSDDIQAAIALLSPIPKPVSASDPAPWPAPESPETTGKASPAAKGRSNVRVLYADDNRDLRTALSLRLQQAGIEVLAVDDGRGAVEEIERSAAVGTPIDLILLDIRMAGMDGYEAARRIRALGFDLPIIALTAWDEDEAPEPDLFQAHLAKPIDWGRLCSLIDTMCGVDRAGLDNERSWAVQ